MSNSAPDKTHIMESKIMININYASRDPEVKILYKDSDDPRDVLVSMLTGHAMPGVNDGYCRIERYAGNNEAAQTIIITPVNPVDMIKHIPIIAQYAHENAAVDTAKVSEQYRAIIKAEYERLRIGGVQE